MECGVKSMEYGVRVCSMECGYAVWSVAYGVWSMEYGIWRYEFTLRINAWTEKEFVRDEHEYVDSHECVRSHRK